MNLRILQFNKRGAQQNSNFFFLNESVHYTLPVVNAANSGFSLCSPRTIESAGQYILSRKSVNV